MDSHDGTDSRHPTEGLTPTSGNHVFVSYSRLDSLYVQALVTHIRAAGFEVWIDDAIDYGSDWLRVIRDRVRRCAALIVVMSPNSEGSKWVEREIHEADGLNKPLLPLLLGGNRWFLLSNIQHYDVTDGSLPDERFLSALALSAPRRHFGSPPRSDGALGRFGVNLPPLPRPSTPLEGHEISTGLGTGEAVGTKPGTDPNSVPPKTSRTADLGPSTGGPRSSSALRSQQGDEPTTTESDIVEANTEGLFTFWRLAERAGHTAPRSVVLLLALQSVGLNALSTNAWVSESAFSEAIARLPNIESSWRVSAATLRRTADLPKMRGLKLPDGDGALARLVQVETSGTTIHSPLTFDEAARVATAGPGLVHFFELFWYAVSLGLVGGGIFFGLFGLFRSDLSRQWRFLILPITCAVLSPSVYSAVRLVSRSRSIRRAAVRRLAPVAFITVLLVWAYVSL